MYLFVKDEFWLQSVTFTSIVAVAKLFAGWSSQLLSFGCCCRPLSTACMEHVSIQCHYCHYHHLFVTTLFTKLEVLRERRPPPNASIIDNPVNPDRHQNWTHWGWTEGICSLSLSVCVCVCVENVAVLPGSESGSGTETWIRIVMPIVTKMWSVGL